MSRIATRIATIPYIKLSCLGYMITNEKRAYKPFPVLRYPKIL